MISLSTHVLDTGCGMPAAGVRVELVGVGEATTDADGRALLAEGLAPGDYRLVFHPPSSFFARVELTMRLEEGHYHVPLLVSPFACVSYRGS